MLLRCVLLSLVSETVASSIFSLNCFFFAFLSTFAFPFFSRCMYIITLTVWHHIRIMAFCFTRLADLERIGVTIIILLIMPKTQLQFCQLFCYPNPVERLWLQSTDPFELSYIDPKYYIHPDKCQNEDCWNQK